jgi:hypothetical protein
MKKQPRFEVVTVAEVLKKALEVNGNEVVKKPKKQASHNRFYIER